MTERRARGLYTFLVFGALPLAALVLTNKADPDLWMHLRAGALMVVTRDVPRVDPYSFALAGAPWVDHEWLFQLVCFSLFAVFGSAGLMVFKGLVGAGAMVCVHGAVARRAESLPVRAFVFLLCSAVFVCLGFTVRPQIFTLLGCAQIVFVHQLSRTGGARESALLDYAPWMLVPWSWFHGGFVAGAALFGLIALGEAVNGRPRGKMLANLILALLATALNPYGFGLWGKVVGMLGSRELSRYIVEWRPFWASGVGLYRGLIAAFAVLLAVAFAGDDDRKGNASEWLLAAAGLAASVLSVRHLLILSIVAAPALALGFEKLRLRSAKAAEPNPAVLKLFGGSVVALLAILSFWILYEVPVREGVPLGALVYGEKEPGWLVYPKGAIEFLRARRFSGKVWSEATVGGYVGWHLLSSRVFLDGRTDLYPADVLEDYSAAMAAAPGWEDILSRRGPDLLLLPVNAPLVEAAQNSGAWRAIYRDPDYVALERGAPAGLPVASPRPSLPWLFP
ncbi:MAG TPA: hypothetical protein VN915_17610 [Elusimicrobiota bacterium]|nr:hypothetical protein [Elusimicrobiota bacterium]